MNYIKRSIGGVVVHSDKGTIEESIGIKAYINDLCKRRLATYEGIVKTTRELLHYRQLCPIYINQYMLLFPLSSIRENHVIFINYYEIAKIINRKENVVELVFYDHSTLKLAMNIGFFRKQVKRCEKIIEFLNKKSLESVYNYGLSIEI